MLMSALVLAVGALTSTVAHGPLATTLAEIPEDTAPNKPGISIDYGRDRLVIDVTTASLDHERLLAQLAATIPGSRAAELTFRPIVIAPDSWKRITTAVLSAVAGTRSAHAVADEKTILIRGITDDEAAWQVRLASLREALPKQFSLTTDVDVVSATSSLTELCLRAFAQSGNPSVQFRRSSAEIRTSSYATLDAIINIAYDCQDMMIAITGHSDSLGNEFVNQRLSLARAQAVADYLTLSGLRAKRLIVAGAGSMFPVAANSSNLGRSQNRRIEFELLPAINGQRSERPVDQGVVGFSAANNSTSNTNVAPGGMRPPPAPRSP